MPHAIWKGYISFGLVSIPIILYPSENKSATVSFRQIDKRNGARIKYQRINSETGDEVPWEDVGKGYEYTKDKILMVEEGELKKVVGENARTIAIEEFVDKKNINMIDIERTFYLVPDKNGIKGYVILREALNHTNKVGIAKVIISTKEYLAAVAIFEDAIVLYTLHYPDEIRKPDEFDIPSTDIKKSKVTNKEIEIAKKLIQSMSAKWKPEQYKDEYRLTVQKWVEEKAKRLPTTKMKQRGEISKGKVVNFMDLLKKSLESSKSKAKTKKGGKFAKVMKPIPIASKTTAKNARHH